MDLLQNVFRAACDGHTHMDDFKISYVLYLTKASGLIFFRLLITLKMVQRYFHQVRLGFYL